MMRLAYLPTNCAWVFLFGDSLCSVDGQNFFRTRKDAVICARSVGLQVDRKGLVSLIPNAVSFA